MYLSRESLALFLAFLFFSFTPAIAEETLSWQDCVKESAKNHPDLISGMESIKQSEAGKKITASALYPQISGNMSAATAKTTSGTGTSATSSTADSYSYGLSGTQLIFDGFKTVDNVKAAAENIAASKQSYRFVSTEVRQRLRTAFINLFKSQESINVTNDIIKVRRENFELITLRYESGLEHKGALLTAEANLAQANFELAQAKRDMELAQWQLTKEMGRKEFVPMRVKADFTLTEAIRIKPDFTILANQHPSLKQLIAQKNAASYGVKSAYANFLPQLTGQAGAGKNDSKWVPQNDQWNLGLSLTVPIFEGGLRFAQVSQAIAAYNQLVADERSTRDGILVNLEQDWTALLNAFEAVGVQEKQLAAAQERSKIAEAQYSTGFISYDNWTIIEDNLVSFKRSYLNAQANALLAEAILVQAKGDTLEYAQ